MTEADCINCGKPAKYNYQKTWKKYVSSDHPEHLWEIWKEDTEWDGGDFEEPTGEDNLFFCEKCAKLFEEDVLPW